MKDFDELKIWAWNRANMMINHGKPEIDRTLIEIADIVRNNGNSQLLHEILLQTIGIYLHHLREDYGDTLCKQLMLEAKEKFEKYEQLKTAN